jgi:hypothetical protein
MSVLTHVLPDAVIEFTEESALRVRVSAEFREMPGLRITIPRPHGCSASTAIVANASWTFLSQWASCRPTGRSFRAQALAVDTSDLTGRWR